MNMTFKNSSILSALALCILLVSCDNDDDFGRYPENAGIEGRVWIQNEFGQPLYEDRAGVSIFLKTGFRSFNLEGDNVGRYRLSGAPVGTYFAKYSKNNCSTIEVRGLRLNTANPSFPVINGFHQFPSVTLTRLPLTSFGNFNAALQGNGNGNDPFRLAITATLIPPPPPTGQAKGYRVFVAVGTQVSRTVYNFQKHLTSTETNIDILLENELFSNIPGTPGSVLSVKLYGDANFDESYEDEAGQLIFPNLSVEPSETRSVVLP